MNVENVNINMNVNNEMNIDQIKSFLFSYLPDFVILVETKLQFVTKKIIKSHWSLINIKWHSVKVVGNLEA